MVGHTFAFALRGSLYTRLLRPDLPHRVGLRLVTVYTAVALRLPRTTRCYALRSGLVLPALLLPHTFWFIFISLLCVHRRGSAIAAFWSLRLPAAPTVVAVRCTARLRCLCTTPAVILPTTRSTPTVTRFCARCHHLLRFRACVLRSTRFTIHTLGYLPHSRSAPVRFAQFTARAVFAWLHVLPFVAPALPFTLLHATVPAVYSYQFAVLYTHVYTVYTRSRLPCATGLPRSCGLRLRSVACTFCLRGLRLRSTLYRGAYLPRHVLPPVPLLPHVRWTWLHFTVFFGFTVRLVAGSRGTFWFCRSHWILVAAVVGFPVATTFAAHVLTLRSGLGSGSLRFGSGSRIFTYCLV